MLENQQLQRRVEMLEALTEQLRDENSDLLILNAELEAAKQTAAEFLAEVRQGSKVVDQALEEHRATLDIKEELVEIPVAVCACGSWSVAGWKGATHQDAKEACHCDCQSSTPFALYTMRASLAPPITQEPKEVQAGVETIYPEKESE